MADSGLTGLDYGVEDENGNWLGSVDPTETKSNGEYKWKEGQTVYSFVKDGNVTFAEKKEDIPTWIDLNEDTGKITVQAPDIVLNSDAYKNTMKPLLTQLSSAYKSNKDYKMPNPFDSKDKKTDYTVKEVVQMVQDGINRNQIALGNYYRTEDWFNDKFGEKAKGRFTPNLYYILGATGSSGEDDDIIAIPNTILRNARWNFLKDASTLNNNTMTVKEFNDLYYHTDAIRDIFGYDNPHEMKEWVRKQILAMEKRGIENLSDEDLEEYMRLQAFNTYLSGNQPTKDLVNGFIEEVWGAGEGSARATADFTAGVVAVVDGVWNRIMTPSIGGTDNAWYRQVSDPVSKSLTSMSNVFANVISGAPITGNWISYDDMLSTANINTELTKQYNDRAQFYVDTNKDAATWYMLGYVGTKIIENYIAGRAFSSVLLGSLGRVAAIRHFDKLQDALLKQKGLDEIPTFIELANGGGAMATGAMSGTAYVNTAITGVANPNMFQLISGLSNIDPASVWNFTKFTTALSAATKDAKVFATALNSLNSTKKILSVGSKVVTIADLIAQTTFDTALQDPVATRKLIEGSGTPEERAILWENAAWNAGGYAAGLLLGQMISAFPKTTTGKTANEAATRKLWQLEGWTSNTRDSIKEKMFGDDFINNIKNPGKKQVAYYKYVLNKAGEDIAKSGGDVAKTLNTAKATQSTAAAIRHMRAVENAISQREAGIGVKLREYKSDAHPEINNAVTTLESETTELAKMLTNSGYQVAKADSSIKIGGVDPTMGINQNINNYVGNLIQKRILDNKLLKNKTIVTSEGGKFNIPGSANFTPEQKRAYASLSEKISTAEDNLPENIKSFIKDHYIPALYNAGTAIRNYRMSPMVGLDIADEINGYISTGMWGSDGSEYAPMMRITEAQKEFADEMNGMVQTTKTGFIRNRNNNPEKIKWGSDADFVNPTLAIERYLVQTASDEINQTLLRENLNTAGIKNVTLFDGSKTGAARTFDSLEPALDKAVEKGLGNVKPSFDADEIAKIVTNEYVNKTNIEKAQTAQKQATKDIEALKAKDVKVSAVERAYALQSMSADNVENILDDAFRERAKGKGYLNDYDKIATIEDALTDENTWNKFILNSPIGVRRAIKRAVNGYADFTGTKFVDTNNTIRGRLNALVPGCDVYDWGLLGREFTNGLTNEGLYTFKGGTPEVQAYIMSTDDLRKLTSYAKNYKNGGDATRVLEELTVKNVQGVIPVKRLGDTFVPGSKFGHAGITAITPIEWYKYFDYLDSKGITSVPVAISQLPLQKPADFGTSEYINRSKSTSELLYERQLAIKDLEEKNALREQWEANDWKTDTGADVREQQQSKNGKKLPGTSKLELLDADIKKAEDLIGQYDKYSIDNSVNSKLGHAPQNITEDMKRMFDEEGYIPFFHNQEKALGSVEYNDDSRVPTGVDAYTYKGGIGDAYWIAPNAAYTDEYGANKLIAKIPTDSLLTDKQLKSLTKEMLAEKKKLLDKGINKKIADTHQKLYKKVEKEFNEGSDDALAALERYENGEIEYDDALEEFAMARMNDNLTSKPEKDMYGDFLDYQGIVNDDNFIYKDGALDYIRDEDVKKYLELDKYIDDFGNVNSYRAIAEKTGKPMIDTTMDMSSRGIARGTAHFYYKDIDPKFDGKMDELLKIQSEGNDKYVWDSKAIENAAKEYEGMPLYEVLDNMYEGNIPYELRDALDAYEDGLIGFKDLDKEMNDAMSRVRGKKLPESALALHMWNKYGKSGKLEDIKFNSKELNKDIVINYLKSQGETGGLVPASEEGKKAWAAIDPTNPANVPVRKTGFEPKKTADQELAEDYGGNYDDYFTHLLEDYTSDSSDSTNSLDNPYLPAPVDDPSLKYDAYKLVSQISPDTINDINKAMIKANKDLYKSSDLITKTAQEQKKARLELAATTRLTNAKNTLNMPTLNTRMEFINTIDNAVNKIRDSIMNDENAVKVLDAIMVSNPGVDTDIARNYVTMVYIKNQKKEILQAAKDVFEYGKFKTATGKMPGTQIAKIQNYMLKEIDKRIDGLLDEARNIFVDGGGEVVDGDKVLKEIHKLMDDIEEASHDANVVDLRQNGESVLVETDPIVANLANYHVIDNTSKFEKAMSNPVVRGMNRLARFFQVTVSPRSMRNQYIRDPLSAFYGTGALPIRDGMKSISKELLAHYDEELVKQYQQMWPDDFKVLKEQAEKEGKNVSELVVNSIMAYGTSTSPALTQTAYYKNPFSDASVSENFWGQLDKTKKTLGKIISKAGDATEKAHQAREIYLRNATYSKGLKDGLDAGMSLEDAMNMAKFFRDNGTTNFRNQLYHLRALAGTVNYFGAGINGYTSFWRLFSLDPIGVSTRLFGGLIVPVIVATAWSLASDENRERYKGLKEYEKDEQFIFVMNGQVYRVPIPQELSVVINPIRHAVESLYEGNKHDFWELMMTDMLNMGPIKFGDLMDIDRNEFAEDPTVLDRIGQLGLSLVDQTMPLALKTIFTFATGIDTYTGQPVNTSYWSFDDEGNRILIGGTQSQFSLKLGKATGWSPSVIAWTTKNLFGTVGRDILDVVVGGADPTTLVSNTVGQLSLTASDYDRTSSDWNRMIADLWKQKEAKYLSEWNDYTDQINKEKDPEQKEKLKNNRKDAIQPFLNKVKTMVNTLNTKYPGMYDRYRFASVVSLLNFDNGVASGTDAASKERDLKNFYANRDQAYQWMQDLGISGSDNESILGHLERDKEGNTVVKINNPLEILSAQSLYYGAEDQHLANITTILESGSDSLKKQKKEVANKITEIYNKGKLTQADYDEIDDMKIEWDKKVIAALTPYVQQVSPEAAINNESVLNYLRNYIYVPDAWKVNNKGYHVTNKSLNYLGSAEDAFADSFIKYVFGVNDKRYDTGWDFSGNKTLGGE